jgi:hypothetical protein
MSQLNKSLRALQAEGKINSHCPQLKKRLTNLEQSSTGSNFYPKNKKSKSIACDFRDEIILSEDQSLKKLHDDPTHFKYRCESQTNTDNNDSNLIPSRNNASNSTKSGIR